MFKIIKFTNAKIDLMIHNSLGRLLNLTTAQVSELTLIGLIQMHKILVKQVKQCREAERLAKLSQLHP